MNTSRQEGPLRIGFVMHVMQVAGAEMLVAETIRRLAGRLSPTVFCLDGVGQLGEELLGEGIDVVSLGRRPGIDLRVVRRLARGVRERRIELLHAHQYSPFFYSALARMLVGRQVRLVLTEHGRHFPDVASAGRRWLNRLLLDRLADGVTACSQFSRDALVTVDGFRSKRIEVIPNGVELANYGPATDRERVLRTLELDSGRRYIATVARFHPVKDHATLLRAFSVVAERLPEVDLLLIGGGPLETDMRALATELGVTARVHFLGIRSDVPEILSAVDLFALTSVSEAASLTLLEAMASELPTVVTRVGGNPEIVEDGVHGRLVSRGDWRGAADAMVEILGDPEMSRRMGAMGRDSVEQRFRLEQTIDRFAAVYESVVGE